MSDTLKLKTLPKAPANLSNPWFVKEALPVRENVNIELLINGERAFGAVAKAIKSAKRSIDIISWGFDPSMRFERPGGKRIGELLADAGKRGVRVRVLIWKNQAAMLKENNLPSQSANSILRKEPGTQNRWFDYIPGVTLAKEVFKPSALSDVNYRKYWFEQADDSDFENLEFRTRDVEVPEWRKSQHAIRAVRESGLDAMSEGAKVWALTIMPSHHQKCVLVDYEEGKPSAIGFVMGHNMLMDYWDTDAHKASGTKGNLRDQGMKPWQDLSTRVQGPVLYDLNDNFIKAWGKGEPWYRGLFRRDVASKRRNIKPENFVAAGRSMTAQISLTNPETGQKSIYATYMQNVGKAWNYIYFENQYFRYAPLAKKLVQEAQKTIQAGRKGILHVFVVTNVPEDDRILYVIPAPGASATTYEMLKVLGKGHTMPAYSRANNKEAAEQAKAQQALKQAGVKAVVATLKRPDGEDIYVHSKLLLIDDSYFLLGSANINERSMFADTELAIASPNARLASQARQSLWKLHTGNDGGQAPCTNESMAQAFEKWEFLMKDNRKNLDSKPPKPMKNHLIDFLYTGKKRPIAGNFD